MKALELKPTPRELLLAVLILIVLVLATHSAQSQALMDIGETYKKDVIRNARNSDWELTDSTATQLRFRDGKNHLIRYYFKLNQVARKVEIFYTDGGEKHDRLFDSLLLEAFFSGYHDPLLLIPKDRFSIVKCRKRNHELQLKAFQQSIHIDVRLNQTRYEGDHE